MDGNLEHFSRVSDREGHVHVGLAGGWVARGVVVYEDHRGGVEFQRAFDDLSRVDGHMIHRAVGLRLIRDQDVFAVKIQDAELLQISVSHGGLAIFEQRVP